VDKKTSNIAPSSIGLFSKPVAWFTDFWEDAICFGTLVSGRIWALDDWETLWTKLRRMILTKPDSIRLRQD